MFLERHFTTLCKVSNEGFSSQFIDAEYIEEWFNITSALPVCVVKDPTEPLVIFDGNHRIVSEIYHLNKGRPYESMDMYIGVRIGVENSKIENLKDD